MPRGKEKRIKPRSRRRKILLACGCALLAVALVCGLLLWFFTACHWGLFKAQNPFVQQEAGNLGFTRGGVRYEYNQDVYNLLLLGTDVGNGDEDDALAGQADVIILLSLNRKTREANLLHIPRDIVVPVRQYNGFGEYLFTVDAPLCTAYAYGDGAVTSGQMMAQAVSEFLYGVPVHRFASVGVNAIPWLANTLGGVPVREYDAFADVWDLPEDGAPIWVQGEMAEIYVRGRSLPGMDGTNTARMGRTEDFMLSALGLIRENAAANPLYLYTLYKSANTYLDVSTDLSTRELTYMASRMMRATLQGQSVQGETLPTGGGENEFTFVVDEAALRSYIEDTFFVPAA